MKEKKLRIEDALNATKAAVEEGIVAGGGTIFVNVIPAVTALLADAEGDEKTGVQIVAKALEEPIRQIAANAGLDLSLIHILLVPDKRSLQPESLLPSRGVAGSGLRPLPNIPHCCLP